MTQASTSMLDMVRGLPEQTLTHTMRNPRSSSDRTFRGAKLFDYVVAAGILPAKMGGGALADGYFVVTAEDGARTIVALAEVWPNASSKTVLLAYEQDGEPVRGGTGVRLVLTGDGLAGRSLGGVVNIELRQVKDEGPHHDVRTTGMVQLTGLVDRPGPIDLRSAPMTDVETVAASGHGGEPITPRKYTGTRLYDLLDAAGIQLTPGVNDDFLRKVVVVRSADGHAVVIAGGELHPSFMNGDVILATGREGGALLDGEGVRLIVPFDMKPGRWAKDIVSVELREG
jgi:DMSO/TMAO reductase YedYZ molybdopterin-dependent catalytic subunit